MSLLFEKMIAMRYLRARRQEGVVSIIAAFSFFGITLGVATLIIVMSVMNGFRQELLTRILGINGHLRLYAVDARPLYSYQELQQAVLKVPGVSEVHPLVERHAMATVPRGASAVVIHGIEDQDLRNRPLLKKNITAGVLDHPLKRDEILVGKRLAEKMALREGGRLSLVIPDGLVTPFGAAPRMKTFTVRGVFEIGMIDYDSAFVFISLEGAQTFFNMGKGITNLEIFTNNPLHVDGISQKIMEIMPPTVGILDWQKANAPFFEAVKVERNVMFVILTLIIVVAAFNIISSLIMLVKDKTTDIAILRTLGVSRAMIMRVFLLVGSSIGVMGSLFGFVLGVSFTMNIEGVRRWLEGLTNTDLFQAEIYFLTKLPAVVDPNEVILVVLMACFLSFGATFYPAWRASKLDPVEALRQA